MTKKITNRVVLDYCLNKMVENGAPDGYIEKVEAMLAALDKKASAERKPTATQIANEGYKAAIAEFLSDCDKPQTVTDILKGVPALDGFSNQKVSALMTQMVNGGAVVKTSDKRRSYFALAE